MRIAVFVASLCCAGCAIRPLPQDVTGYDAYQIVQKIRCETQDAIKSYVLGALDSTDPIVAQKLRSGALPYSNFNRRILSPDGRAVLDKYDQAAVAYDFTFDITEKNDVTASADFLRTVTRGPFTLGLSATSERQRQNTRNFRIADTFDELVTKIPTDYCADDRAPPNYIYPITGRIGVIEIIGAFLDLNQSGGLTGTAGAPGVPVLADTISFTTTFTASTTPKIVLAPLSKGFDLSGAGINADATRSDVHKVIIAVSLPPETVPAGGKKVSRVSRESAKSSVNSMINYQVYRSLLNRGVIVPPP